MPERIIEEAVRTLLQRGQLSEALEQVLATFGPELRGYLRGSLSDIAEGDDVYQSVTIAIWERLTEFRFESSLRTWCYAIAHNQLRKRFARFSRRHGERLDTGQQDRLPARSLSSLIEHQQRADAAAAATALLSAGEREILILRAERGLSFGEIAKVLELSSEANARQRFHRAKEHLKELLTSTSSPDEI